MARRTYSDVDSYVSQRIGNRGDITSAQRGHWINDALQKCANEYEHPEMEGICTETLTATTDSITPSTTDLWWPTMVKDATTGRLIRPGDKERIENILTKPTNNPYRCYWYGRIFYFDAKPSSNLSIRIWYQKQPAEWSSGNSVLDKLYDPIIELYSTGIAFNFLREFDKAELANREAKAYAADMKLPVRQARLYDYMTGFEAGGRGR